MKNTMESARALAEKAKAIIIENHINNTFIDDYLIEWDMKRRMVFVTIGKYVYCGHIIETFEFVRWSRERA